MPAALRLPPTALPAHGGRAAARIRAVLLLLVCLLLVLQALAAGVLLAKAHDHHHADPVMAWLGDDHARAHALGEHHHHTRFELAIELDAPAMGLDSASLLLLLGLLALTAAALILAELLPQPCPAARVAAVVQGYFRRLDRPPQG